MDNLPPCSIDDGLSPRLRDLKAQLIASIPCAPEERQSRDELATKPLDAVIINYMTWVDRLISKRPRRVDFAPDFWKCPLPVEIQMGVANLMQLFSTGGDLSPYLSRYALTHGYVATPEIRRRGPDWADGGRGAKDFAVNVFDVHHLHFTPTGETRRRGPSDALLFVNLFRDGVRFLMVGDHKSFDGPELRRRVATARRDAGLSLVGVLPPRDPTPPPQLGRMLRKGINAFESLDGDVVPVGMVATNGTSLWLRRHVDVIMGILEDWDEKLDSPAGCAELAGRMGVPANLEGAQWQFDHGDFCLVDRAWTAYIFRKWIR